MMCRFDHFQNRLTDHANKNNRLLINYLSETFLQLKFSINGSLMFVYLNIRINILIISTKILIGLILMLGKHLQ